MNCLNTFIITCLTAILLTASQTEAQAQSRRFGTFSLRNGLSQGTATTITKDKRGFMWIGTRDGLNRFDGYNFEILKNDPRDSISISNNSITALAESKDGFLWAGTELGLNRIDLNTLQAKHYYHFFDDPKSLSNNKITAIIANDDNTLWIGTANGLNKMDPENKDQFETYFALSGEKGLSSSVINCLFIDSKNNLWVGTDDGLNQYVPEIDSFETYKHESYNENSLSHNNITSICEDNDGHIWIGTRNGLNRFNPDHKIFSRYFAEGQKQIVPSNIINQVVVDQQANMWIGTPSGLSRVAKDTRKTSFFYTIPGVMNTIPNDYILCIYQDEGGIVWVGTNAAGVVMINLHAPEFFPILYSGQQGYAPEQNQIYSFLDLDSNKMLIGTGMGVAEFDFSTKKSKFFTAQPSHALSQITTAVLCFASTLDGTMWIGTGGQGLAAYNKVENEIVFYNHTSESGSTIPGNYINSIAVNSEGNLWVGTAGGGVGFLDRTSNSFESFKYDSKDNNAFRDNNIKTIAVDGYDNVWFGTGNPGLYYLESKTGDIKYYPAGDTSAGELPANAINEIYIDRLNEIWVATSGGGLSKYVSERDGFITYTNQNGLGNDVVLSIRSDERKNLWLSTNGGISTFNYLTETFRNYNEQAALAQNTFFPRSAQSAFSRLFVFGGSNGFIYIDSKGITENLILPPLVITGFQLINQKEKNSSYDISHSTKESVTIDYNHSGFAIEFAALNFNQPHKNQYAYRLKGLFDNWRYIGTRNFATFSNLNPGTYTFEMIGSNNDGYWNDHPATLQIIVEPAYWQTSWFRILVIVAILALLYLYYRYKLSGEIERNQRLERAVVIRTSEIAKERDTNAILLKEIHHRVKNNLQVIISLLNLQLRYIKDNKLYDVFSEIQNRVRSMSLIHEKMYKSKDIETIDIQEYVRDLAKDLIDIYRLEQKIELDIEVGVNRFNSDTLTPLGLIINEIISNAMKHAFKEDKSGKIFVRLNKLEKHRFRLIIGDNGIGMPGDFSNTSVDSFGTELIAALSEQLNGTIKLLPDGRGTMYQLDFEDFTDS